MGKNTQTIQPYVRKGWCPGALKPMASGDGYIVRVKPWMAVISCEQAQKIAEIAQNYGANTIELTSKANIQIRGIKLENLEAVQQRLKAAQLLDETEALERRRNILVHPELILSEKRHEAKRLYRSIVEALNNYSHEITTPAKFSFLIDTADSDLLARAYADVRFEVSQSKGNLLVRLAFGGDRFTALDYGLFSLTESVSQAFNIIEAFFNTRPDQLKIQPWLLKQQDVNSARCNMDTPVLLDKSKKSENPGQNRHDLYSKLKSFMPYTLLSSALGEFSLEKWQAMIHLLHLNQSHEIVITPHKAIVLAAVAEQAALEIIKQKQLDVLLPLSKESDFNLHACSGKPNCQSAKGETKALLESLSKQCSSLLDGSVHLHVSACAKGCAYAAAADIVVVIEEDGYRLGFTKKASTLEGEVISFECLQAKLKTLNEQYRSDTFYNNASEFLAERM